MLITPSEEGCLRCGNLGATQLQCLDCGHFWCSKCLTGKACETSACPECHSVHCTAGRMREDETRRLERRIRAGREHPGSLAEVHPAEPHVLPAQRD